jgi:hypothetical protein
MNLILDTYVSSFFMPVRQSSNCTAPGEKCAGARNFPLFPYVPCCDSNLVCAERQEPPEGTWGRFCISPTDASESPVPSSGNVTVGTTVASTTAVPGATGAEANETTAAGGSAEETIGPNAMESMAPNATETIAPNATETALPNATETILPNGTRASVSPSPSSNNDSVCFPSHAVVELVDGSCVTMEKLSIGDVVKVGPNAFSKVFMFTHKLRGGVHEFVHLTTSTGVTITLTSGHYIPVDGRLIAASSVTIGSRVQLGNGAVDKIVSIRNVIDAGLYNPQTLDGGIVVNGVVASTYTIAVEPQLAHAILAPFRSLFAFWGVGLTILENGGGILASLAPRGKLVV